MGMPRHIDDLCIEAAREAAATQKMNSAFGIAMNNAIRRGREHPHVGIKTDTSPFTGKFIHAEPLFSGCSSSGALCVEAAGIVRVGTDPY